MDERGTRYTGSYRATVWTALEWLKVEIGANTPLREVGPLQINDAIGRRRAEGVSNATINRTVIEPLRRIFIRARDKWGIASLQRIDWELEPESKERVRVLAIAEETDLAANMRADYLPAVKFALLSGARKASVVALKKADVDMPGRRFTLTGKGDKRHTLPMTDELRAILGGAMNNPTDHVFTYVGQRTRIIHTTADKRAVLRGERYPITIAGLNRAWRTYGPKGAAGIADFRFHDLRHTAATRILRRTGNLKLVQRLLDHEDIATTAKYAHVDDADLLAAMEAESRAHAAELAQETGPTAAPALRNVR